MISAPQQPSIVRRGEASWRVLGHHGPSPSDKLQFVYDPWVKQVNPYEPFRSMDRRQLHRYKQDVLVPLVERCGLVVAASPVEGSDTAYGFICGEVRDDGLQVLHFVYVKNMYRGHGIGTHLMKLTFTGLGKRPVYYTHETRTTRAKRNPFRDRWGLIHSPHFISGDYAPKAIEG